MFFFPETDNGFLTIETLKGILLELEPNLPDEDLAQIVEEVDEDGSGTIDFDGKIFIIQWEGFSVMVNAKIRKLSLVATVVFNVLLLHAFAFSK